MSSFTPPQYNSDAFNSDLFANSTDSLSISAADQRYLRIGSTGYLTSLSAASISTGTLSINGSSALTQATADNRYLQISSAFTQSQADTLYLSLSDARTAYLTSITAGTASANKALVIDSSRNLANINQLSVSSLLVAGSPIINADPNGWLSGVVAGTASANKALIAGGSANISGIGTLSCSQINVSGFANLSNSGLNIGFWDLSYQSAGVLRWFNNATVDSEQGSYRIYNAFNSTYSGYFWDLNSRANGARIGFTLSNNDSARRWSLFAPSQNFQITARSDVSLAPNMWISSNGCTVHGRSAISNTAPWVEVAGSMLLSTNSSTWSCSAAPQITINHNTLSSDVLHTYIQYGSRSNNTEYFYDSWKIAALHSSTDPFENSYTEISSLQRAPFVNKAGGGLRVFYDGRVCIARGVAGGGSNMLTGPQMEGTLHVLGSVSHNVSTGYRLLSNGVSSFPSTTISSCIYASGAITAASGFWAPSDHRLKENIERIEYETAKKLLEVDAVYYSWKSDPENKKESGVIAQTLLRAGLNDLVELIRNPEMEEDGDELNLSGFQWLTRYDRISVYLLAIVKKQHEDIEELKRKLSSDYNNAD